MGFEEAFIPEKLIEARHAIAVAHSTYDNIDHSEPSEDTRELIERLCDVSFPMLRATALSLPDRDIRTLAGYIPYNHFEVDETKLTGILKQRLDERSCRILFENWQESYDNPECNKFLKDIAEYDDSFGKYLSGINVDSEKFIEVLDSVNIPLGYDEIITGCRFRDGEDFSNKLKEHGVIEGSFLDIECKRALLTFCSRADYLDCSQENILYIIEGYDEYMLRKFVLNFMDKMSLSELQIYPAVAEYLRSVLGNRKSEVFAGFFEETDPEVVQKYIDWINIYKINLYFEEDERSRFWKKYRYVNVIRYPVSDIVILEFERHLAVEFLGVKKGTIYICEKEAFKQTFYEELDQLSNEDMRAFFKIHKDQCIESRNHIGRWQAHIDNTIVKKQITEKIEI